MFIVGGTECGKTHYLLDFLEKNYKGYFDYIFLICPTFIRNKTYQDWKYKDDEKLFTIPCDHDQVEDFLKYISKTFAGTNSLIILDDCACGQTVKNRTSELVRLAFSGRHDNLSTIVITQKITAISQSFRENIAMLVTFDTPSSKVWQTIMDEFLDVSKEELNEIVSQLKRNKYARLEILLRQPRSHRVVYS